jgi:exodeoxyribonuclease-3
LKIASYNINGLRAAIRKGLLDWITATNYDVYCFQEIKIQADQIRALDFDMLSYKHYWHCAEKKGYSGVGILSRRVPDRLVYGCGIEKYDREGRILRADFGDLSVLSVYFPSGSSGDHRQEIKMAFLKDFYPWLQELRKERPSLILAGDFNICHKPIDIHDPVRNKKSSGFLPEEREWMDKLLSNGFVDSFRLFHPEPDQYTWWSLRSGARAKNKGWRIDYQLVSEPLKAQVEDAGILPDIYHSDHCPTVLQING